MCDAQREDLYRFKLVKVSEEAHLDLMGIG